LDHAQTKKKAPVLSSKGQKGCPVKEGGKHLHLNGKKKDPFYCHKKSCSEKHLRRNATKRAMGPVVSTPEGGGKACCHRSFQTTEVKLQRWYKKKKSEQRLFPASKEKTPVSEPACRRTVQRSQVPTGQRREEITRRGITAEPKGGDQPIPSVASFGGEGKQN